jgi:V/A-type H+-transporting ATPase subunit E
MEALDLCMKETETGKDKVKKICDILRRETLEPAQVEAEGILLSASESAVEIIAEARREVKRQKNVFESSLHQACKQALEALKGAIEGQLLHKELGQLIGKKMQDTKILADLIEAVLRALKEQGIEGDLSVYIPAAVPARSVNTLLAQEWLEDLKEKSVLIGTISGGIAVKWHQGNVTIDISDATLRELVAQYIRKDFRELIFGS